MIILSDKVTIYDYIRYVYMYNLAWFLLYMNSESRLALK
jgi:hypothetical protein